METRKLSTFIAFASSAAALAMLLLFFDAPLPSLATGLAAPRAAPTVTGVTPSSALNDVDTPITIAGTNFASSPIPVVRLGAAALPNVNWVSGSELTATMPWGLVPGVYTMTVTNGDGQSGALANAFTVTLAIGVWTSGGPYGGFANEVAVSPIISRTAFAAIQDAGLFRTTDSGDNWALALFDSYPWGVGYGIAPTNTLYYWGSTGLWKSDNEGQTFQQIYDREATAFAPDPVDPRHLWIGRSDGIYDIANGTMNWTAHTNGLALSISPTGVAVDPTTPTTLYAVYRSGAVYKTTNSGDDWITIRSPIPNASEEFRLAIDPFNPQVLLFTRALMGGNGSYRSEDGGTTWSPLTLGTQGSLSDFAFSPFTPGTVYGLMRMRSWTSAVSSDHGLTWSPYGSDPAGAWIIALDPATGLPAYVGDGGLGAERSLDGGMTWQVVNQGISGISVSGLAAVPGKPDTVFAAGATGYASNNAGHTWRDLQMPYADASLVSVSGQNPNYVYMSRGMWVYSRSADGGTTWDQLDFPFPGTLASLRALKAAPTAAGVVYGGGGINMAFHPGQNEGKVYRSNDYATTWITLNLTVPMSRVMDIAIDPTNADIVYAAASGTAGGTTADMSPHPGKGVFYSPDGGVNWYPRKGGIGDVPAFSLAIHPTQPQILYATAWLSSENKITVFRSSDGGNLWSPSPQLRVNWASAITWAGLPIAIDPASPNTIYLGTPKGLYRSTDAGKNWTQAGGGLGQTLILALAASSDKDHTNVYVSTPGGMISGGAPIPVGNKRPAVGGYLPAGVHKETISYRNIGGPLFLPLVRR